MANQSSNNSSNSNNNTSPSDSSSSQVNEQITFPRANSANQNNNQNLDLSRGFDNKNYSPMGSNNNLGQNNNLALGQKKPNRNSDLDKPGLDDKDEKDDKNKNNSNKQQPHNDSPSNKTDSNNKNSNDSTSKHNNDDSTNHPNNAYNPNNTYDPNNANKIGNNDNETDPNKFRKNDNQNTNREAAKQATNNNNNSNDTESENNDDEKTNFNLLNNAFLHNPVIRTKVIIAGSIIGGVVIGALLLISILNALIASISSSMCGNGSLGSSYSGSGDVLEFMCGMQSPVENITVTDKFGPRICPIHGPEHHDGIDLGVSLGNPVAAAQSGRVVGTDTSRGYGHDVVIDHGGGIFTRYAHNSKLLVKKGDIISKGQQIAEAGNTGDSDGVHVHFEIMKTTENDLFSGHQDPNDYFVDHDNFMKSCGSRPISNNNSNNNIFVGDSRTVGIKNLGLINNSNTVAKGGKSYEWFVNSAISKVNTKMKKNKKYNIITWMGVNYLKRNGADKYFKKYSELAKGAWSKHTIYVVSVGTVKPGNINHLTANDVKKFNAKMKSLINKSNIPNLKYIELSFTEAPNKDGLHYTNSQYRAIYNDITNQVRNTTSTTLSHSSNQSSGTSTTSQQAYDSIKILKTLKKSTGSTKSISVSGRNPQSFAYNDNYYYVQWIAKGASGKDGYIYKYDSNISYKSSSPSKQSVGHGNGLTYSTADNKLYSVTVSGIRDNRKATILDTGTLKVTGTKSLDHGTSAIAYDRLTNRFITSSGVAGGSASSTGYLYVYNSDLSTQVGAESIAKKRWKTPGDIAAYGGIVYVTISSYGTNGSGNYIDMYNEDNGDYLGSYSAPYGEIEGIDINDDGEIVLLFHSPDMIQFTGIKANVITSSGESVGSQSGDQCCVNGSSTTYTYTGSDYCPNGITVTGDYAGTYELDDYIERVVTAENGGAHPEALKALAIAARTYALNRTDNCQKSIENSTSAQVMAQEASDRVKEALANVKGSIMLYNGNYFSAQYSSFYGKCNGTECTSTFIKTPSEEKATFTMPYTYLTTAADAGHEYGLSQNGSHYMATVQGKTYDEILKFFYADGIEITGTSSSTSTCSLGGSGTYQNGKIWDYNQADYSDPYCGGTIADSGCGPTAMAMVVSTFLKEQHDPPELAKITTDTGLCSTETHDYFKKAAEKYNLTYQKLGSDSAEEVMNALNRGDSLVIANVTNENKVDGLDNFWTEGGHYIVLAGHDGRDVWVQDPNKGMESVHRTNTKGDGVYNFDKYIKPAATNGYMIFKKA